MHGERRKVLKGHARHFSVAGLSLDFHEAGRGLKLQLRGVPLNGNHSRLEQHRGHANRVRAGHRRVLDLLHDHEPGVRLRYRWRKNQIAIRGWIPSGLSEHKLAKTVPMLLEMLLFLKHAFPGNIGDASDNHPARFTAGMRVNSENHPCELQRSPSDSKFLSEAHFTKTQAAQPPDLSFPPPRGRAHKPRGASFRAPQKAVAF